MKLFLQTQLIAVPYLMVMIFFLSISNETRIAIIGLCFSFALVIFLSTLIAKLRWISVYYACLNYLLDLMILYGILVALQNISPGSRLDNNGEYFIIFFSFPITTAILAFGCFLGVVINMSRSDEEENT